MLRIGLDDQNHQIWSSATAKMPDGAVIDLSTSTVHYAFITPSARPSAPDWKAGAWVGGFPSYSLTPLGIPLTLGLWNAWRKLTLGSVVIEELVDQIAIY